MITELWVPWAMGWFLFSVIRCSLHLFLFGLYTHNSIYTPKHSPAGAPRSALYLAGEVSAFISGPWGSFSSFALGMFFWPLQACDGSALVFSHKLRTFSFFVIAIIISCDIYKSLLCSSWSYKHSRSLTTQNSFLLSAWICDVSPVRKSSFQSSLPVAPLSGGFFWNMCEKVIISHNYVNEHLNSQFYKHPYIYVFLPVHKWGPQDRWKSLHWGWFPGWGNGKNSNHSWAMPSLTRHSPP